MCLQADLAPEVLAYLKRAASIVLSVTAASLLAALFLSRKLQHVISEPMRSLVAGTQELAGGNLSARVTVTSSDELGELAHAFNEMAGSLQQSHEEVFNQQRNLERAVAERTEELARSNAELERFNRLATGRELRMIELKRQINELAQRAGESPLYDLSFTQLHDEEASGNED